MRQLDQLNTNIETVHYYHYYYYNIIVNLKTI